MSTGQDVLSELGVSLTREWVLGNGLGGSASGTAAGANTRREHAYLAAADSRGRATALLLRLQERLLVDGAPLELALEAGSPARFAGQRPPEAFRLDPWPIWHLRTGESTVEKSLFLIYGHHAVTLTYRHLGGPETRLTVSPLVVARDLEAVMPEGLEPRGVVESLPGRVRIETVPERPSLTLWHNGTFMPARARQQLRYAADEVDGAPEEAEEALVPGYIETLLAAGGALHLVASAEDHLMRALAREDRLGTPPPRTLADCVAALEADERERGRSWRRAARAGASVTRAQAREARARTGAESGRDARGFRPGSGAISASRDRWIAPLAEALRLGLARREGRLTLLSSLPGSAERGRDALCAVPGLISLRGFGSARELIESFVEYLDEGLAPESFDRGDGRPRYGDPQAALWLVIAGELYARRSDDRAFASERLFPALESVTRYYRGGTRGGIRVDADGLLLCGEGAVKRADLNALWYRASLAVGQLARATGRKETGAFLIAWAHEVQRRFNEALWDEERGCLFESLGPDGPIAGLDRSQLLAAGLPPALLPPERALRLVETVRAELFTPFGLRDRPDGERVSTAELAWFHSAYLRAHGRSAGAQAQVRSWLGGLREHLDREACGAVPEGFVLGGEGRPIRVAGDPLSVTASAALLRLIVEELDGEV